MGAQGEFFERPETIIVEPVAEEAAPIPSITISEAVSASPAVASSRRTMKDLSIPKLYYSISEVSRLTALEPYVLRYWETEFDDLRPQKNRAGNRIYSNKDIKLILRIKKLLREQRYTIEGAKAIFRTERYSDSRPVEEATPVQDPAQIPLPTDKPTVPQAPITLEEVRALKSALAELRSVFK